MSIVDTITAGASAFLERRTSRRGFLGRSAVVGSALTVAGPSYILRPGTAYAEVTRLRCPDCTSGLCCDGYTEFCCHLNDTGANECPPGTLLAGWWKVDNSDFCFGTARYYMDCNRASPGCSCGSSGACQDRPGDCGCRSCSSRKDSCTVFRYGNCHNEVACVGPIVCRLVTCAKPWEIEPTCSRVPRTDNATRNHHRPCLERDPDETELAFVRALFQDYLGRDSDPSGEAFFGNQLVRGAHLEFSVRDIVAESFAFSAEYVGVVVDDQYDVAFGRAGEPTGREYWSDQLTSGTTPQRLAVILLSSDEFWDAAGQTDDGFVRRLYERVLGRAAGDAEVERFVAAMAEGTSREAVATEVFASAESRGRRVDALYGRFLDRAVEPTGRDYWADVLLDREDITLALFLSASDEYLDRAVRRFPPAQDPAEEPDEPVVDPALVP